MALPNSNISVAMVKSELGAATNDVGRLCTHPNINKWSKWKPVRHNSVVPITEGDLKTANAGFNLLDQGSAYGVSSFYKNNNFYKFEYLKPLGNNTSPYRLDDFRGYEHNSEIFYAFTDPLPTKINYTQKTLNISYFTLNTALGNVLWSDILGSDYGSLGYVISKDGVASSEIVTYADGFNPKIRQQIDTQIDLSSLLEDEIYRLSAFIKTDRNEFIPIENGNLTVFIYEGKKVTVTLTAIHNTISQKVNWTLSLYNKTTETVIVGPAEIGIKYNSSDFKANPIGDEQELVFPSVYVPALGYFNQSGSFENIPYPNDMYVYFYDYYTEELFKQINIQ